MQTRPLLTFDTANSGLEGLLDAQLNENGLLTLTLARPPLNVLNTALLQALARLLEQAATDARVQVLLLSAQGERYFSAGVDVAEHGAPQVDEMLAAFHAVARQLYEFPLPTVAALNGTALGGGLELALACDLRLAVADAQLGQPEIRLAVFAPVAAILLPRLLPAAVAREMLLGGRVLSAAEAMQFGLLNRLLPRTEFVTGVTEFLAPYLQLSRAAQLHNKRALRCAEERCNDSFAAQLHALERQYLGELMATQDAHEGIAAFMEKRPPRWRHA